MFASLATWFTKKKIARENSQRKKNFLDWHEIKSISLIFESGEKFSKNEMDNFISSLKKHCEVYFIETKSKQATYGDWKCIVAKDKNFLALPKSEMLKQVQNKKSDLLICVNRSNSVFSASLISSFSSHCRCGNYDFSGEMDLIVARKENQDLIAYLKEVVKYLQMIRTQ